MSDNIEGHTIRYDEQYGDWLVYQYGTYSRSSVLAGQWFDRMIDGFATKDEALRAYPKAEYCESFPIRSAVVPSTPWPGFDPADAGERWDEDY